MPSLPILRNDTQKENHPILRAKILKTRRKFYSSAPLLKAEP